MDARSARQGELIGGINVTPLVDVVLVLLIVLMVTASYTVSKALPVQLPQASTGENAKASTLVISIDAGGSVRLDGQVASLEAVRERAQQLSAVGSASAQIAADGSAQHRVVVSVLDALRSAGLMRFSIQVAPPGPAL